VSIEAGQSLLHYRLVEKIGEGGMGVVWKATDTTLDREVAIKILPDVFSADPDRLGRFEREAKLLASLNHPNIAGVYGLHEAGGVRFLAMELVSGEDLAKRLAKGPIEIDDAIRIALQVAEALEAAHENGTVHRDLKPANVLLTPDGSVKVLDFGLAKALSPETSGAEESPSLSPTLTSAGTVAGMIIGTAAYMSPEQAKGKPVDRRADVWAFGVVLYEMLTGRQMFTGETISETLAAVLLKNAEMDALPENTPPGVRALLERCLTKDVKQRLRDIGEARIALERPEASTLGSVAATIAIPLETPSVWRRALPWTVAAVAIGLAAIALTGWAPWDSTVDERVSTHLRSALGADTELFADYGAATVISPDGRRIVYVSGTGAGRSLFLRNLDSLESKSISGSDEAYHPFFSPDGQWIGFVTREKLKKVSAFGGTPIGLADLSLSRGATWSPDGTIVYAPSPNSGLMRVNDEGGEPRPVTELDKDAEEVTHRWPHFLPGFRSVLFTSHSGGVGFNDARIEVVDLETGERKLLHRGGSYARYVPTGHIAYVREGTLYAMPFDLEALEVIGPPFPVLEDVTSNASHGSAQFDFSATGTLVWASGTATRRVVSLVELERQGRSSVVAQEPGEFYTPRYSPDGSRIAMFVGAFDDADVWIVDLARGTRTRLTFSDKADWAPVWSPDGETIAFSSGRAGIGNLYRKPADGSEEAERITESEHLQAPASWSPDGRFIAFSELTNDKGWDIEVLDTQSGEVRPFLETRFQETGPDFSPDGDWLAYFSNESGRYEVYVRPFPGPGGKWQISTDGGTQPRWSRDGNEILYTSLDSRLVVVPLNAGGSGFSADKPVELADVSGYTSDFFGSFDISPGGDSVLLLRAEGDSGDSPDRSHVNFILDWFTELERKATAAGS
jgi:serine/threonine-protein kinase